MDGKPDGHLWEQHIGSHGKQRQDACAGVKSTLGMQQQPALWDRVEEQERGGQARPGRHCLIRQHYIFVTGLHHDSVFVHDNSSSDGAEKQVAVSSLMPMPMPMSTQTGSSGSSRVCKGFSLQQPTNCPVRTHC